jgi:hypothetical protein
LALTRYPDKHGSDESEIAALDRPASHVAYMRHEAELVVKYESMPRLDVEGLQWAGVFKPVRAVDNSFSAAEPPAHDDWVPNFIADKSVKRDVNVALRRIREGVSRFLAPAQMATEARKSGRSVAALADSLSGLIGAVPGTSPGRRRAGKVSPASGARPHADIVDMMQGTASGGRRLVAFRVALRAKADATVALTASVGVGVEGSVDRDTDRVSILGWLPGDLTDPLSSSRELQAAAPRLTKGETAWLLVEADSNIAVDVAVNAEVAD